jgi:hypothetical protein
MTTYIAGRFIECNSEGKIVKDTAIGPTEKDYAKFVASHLCLDGNRCANWKAKLATCLVKDNSNVKRTLPTDKAPASIANAFS